MPLTPVDFDPFADAAPAPAPPPAPRTPAAPKLTAVDYDPFGGSGPSTGRDASGQMLFPSSFVETPDDPLGDLVADATALAHPNRDVRPPLRAELTDRSAAGMAAVLPVAAASPPGPTTSNWLAGAGARVNELLGAGVRGVANVAEPIGDRLELAVPLSGIPADTIRDEKQLQSLYDLADWFEENAAAYGYTPGTSIDAVKEALNPGANAARQAAVDDFTGRPGSPYARINPLERIKTVLAFMGEQGVVSTPDMAAAIAALPAYLLGRTEEIGERRVELNNPELVAAGAPLPEPGLGDLAAAAPAAAIESLLERFATGRLFPGRAPVGGSAAGRIATEGVVQTGTEAIEETVANLGESLGTERGVVAGELGDAALGGSLGGLGIGTTMQGGKEVVRALVGENAVLEGAPSPELRKAVLDPKTPQAVRLAASLVLMQRGERVDVPGGETQEATQEAVGAPSATPAAPGAPIVAPANAPAQDDELAEAVLPVVQAIAAENPELAAQLGDLVAGVAAPVSGAPAPAVPANVGGSPAAAGADSSPEPVNGAAGSRENPLPEDRMADAPVGAWVRGPAIPGAGENLFQIREVPLEQLDPRELSPTGEVAGDKKRDVDAYRARLEAGEQAPNARGYELEDGSGRVSLVDGHRRYAAARAAGRQTLRLAVSPMPTTDQRADELGDAATEDELLTDARATRARAEALAAEAGEGGSVAFSRPDGQRALAGPDMSKPGGYRLTRFDAQGQPFAHSEYSTLAEAAGYALMEGGFEPDAELGDTVVGETERPIRETAPAPRETPAPPAEPFVPGGRMFQSGRNAQAVQLADGTWRVRTRKAGQWQPWQMRAEFDASGAFGYRPYTPPGGYVDVDGRRVRLAPKEAKRADTAPAGPPKPKTLLQVLVGSKAFKAAGGLNRDAFAAEFGVDPAEFATARVGIQRVFTKDGGMRPDDLREWLEQEGYFPAEDPDAPPTIGTSEAYDLLRQALDGEDVFALDQQEEAGAWLMYQRDEEERYRDELEATLADQLPDIDDADMAEAVAYAWAAAEREARQQEARDGADAEANEGDRRPREAGSVRPTADADTALAEPAAPQRRVDASPREAAPVSPAPSPRATSTKNAVTAAERNARGADPILKALAQTNEQTLELAQDVLADNPAAGREVAAKLRAEGTTAISLLDEAVLLVDKVRLRNERDAAGVRAADPKATPEAREVARREWEAAEAAINDLDQAAAVSGREWGRFGQFRQRMLREDFTFEALERRERVREGRPLTAEESAQLREYADRVARLERKLAETQQALDDANNRAGSVVAYRALLEEMAKVKPGRKVPPATLRQNASASLAALREVPLESRSGDLFGPPTTRDAVDAARRAKDERRDGRTGTGRTDMAAGDGELFAGERPEQADLDTPLERRGEGAPGSIDEVAAAVQATIGPNGARHVTVLASPDDPGLPAHLRGRAGRRTEAFFDPRTGRVFIFADRVSPARACWVAAHEVAGHVGIRGMLDQFAYDGAWQRGRVFSDAFDALVTNPTVRQLADAIADENPDYSGDIATEEALAELAAATRTGDYAGIEQYGVTVPQAQRATLRGLVARLVAAIRRLFSRGERTLSDADVYRFLDGAWRHVKAGGGALASTGGPRASQALDRVLVAAHNTTARKLEHAMRMGGFAVPSLAVTRAGETIDGFGDITLIADPSLADPQRGAKAFGADAYSPRYPEVLYKLTPANVKRLNALIGAPGASWSNMLSVRDLTSEKPFKEHLERTVGEDWRNSDADAEAARVLREAGATEHTFEGFTASGNRRYALHTLENVVKKLRKDLRGGENFNYGVGSLRARYTPQFRSVGQIRKEKSRLISSEEFEAVSKEVDAEFFALLEKIAPHAEDGQRFGFADKLIDVFGDAAKLGLPRAMREYGIDGVPDEVMRDAARFLGRLRNMPTEYFEVIQPRAVEVNEFRAAVVPSDTSPELRRELERRGLEVVEYPAGDKAARREAIKATASSGDLLFSRAPSVSSPAFRRWFGDSVVTEDWEGRGEPRRLYHATTGSFDAFRLGADATDPLGRTSGPVIFLTDDPARQNAAHNVGGFGGQFKDGANVMPLYARIERPLYMNDGNRSRIVAELGLGRGVPQLWTSADVAAVEGAGYDGVIRFTDDETPTEVIAFSRSQVKSAVGNRGTFDPSSDSVLESRSRGTPAVTPTQFFHLSRVGAVPLTEGATTFDAWAAQMRSILGSTMFEAFEDAMPEVYEASKMMTSGDDAPEVTIDPESITHRDVYNLARKHVQAGVRGEDAVMAAVTADVQAVAPDFTERDVRRLFAQYGQVTFPSKEADKVALRELRALVQMQESIDRLEAGLPALKSGPQRDKATQAIREKRRVLNDLLKQQAKSNANDPERLATYQQARATNLENQIADLEKQIATGERPTRTKPAPPSPELAALIARRDALRAERDAIDNPRSTRENEAKKRALKKLIEGVEARLRGDTPETRGPVHGPDDAEVTALKTRLASLREALAALTRPKLSPEARHQRTQAKTIARQLADVQARLAANDYARRPRPEPKELNAANKAAKLALAKVKAEFARRQFEADMAKRHPVRKVFGAGAEALNLARAYLTSLDFSALLRQGGFIAFGHPLRAAKSVPDALRAFVSEADALAQGEAIFARPNAPLYKKFGLELTQDGGTSLSKMEEAFMSRWLQKMPRWLAGGLVRGSSRAFVSTLNRIRADSFDAMLAALTLKRVPTQAEGEAIANFINVATGRGHIGTKGNAGATGLNTVFFAPRLVASRFNLLALQPVYGGTMRTRAMILAEYARFLMGVSVVFALAFAAADDEDDDPLVTLDPRSSNFLKIKFNNTYIDPMTGLSQVTVFLARLLTGETVTGAGELRPLRDAYRLTDVVGDGERLPATGYGDTDVKDVVANFLRTKLAPVPGQLATVAIGEDFDGNVPTVGSVVVSSVVPIGFQDVHDVMTDNGLPKGAAIFGLSLLGMGVQYRAPDINTVRNRLAGVADDELEAEFARLREQYADDVTAGQTFDRYVDNASNRREGRAGRVKRDSAGRPKFKASEEPTSTPPAMRPGRDGWQEEGNASGKPAPVPFPTFGLRNPPKMVMVGSWKDVPNPGVRKRLDEGALGVFDDEANTVYVVMGLSPEETRHVAFHETAGHYGLRRLMGDGYETILNRARQNPTVEKLANAMRDRSYSEIGVHNRLSLTEEALAELAAAAQTGDYAPVEAWGVRVPPSARNGLEGVTGRAVQDIGRKVSTLLGVDDGVMNDAEVLRLLEASWRGVRDGQEANRGERDD